MKGSGLLNALLVAAVLAVCAGRASAATYYVDGENPAASDDYTEAQAQNEATPYKTLCYAGWVAKPGDTVLVKGGNYPDPHCGDQTQVAMLMQNGEEARLQGKPYWTTFKAYPGHHPHIRFEVRQGTPAKGGIHIEGSYIIVDGFEVSPEDYPHGSYGSGNGIYATDGDTTASHHIIIRNCNVHDCPNAGIGGLWIDYMTVENNTVWNNARHSCENSSGIGFYQPHDSGIDFGTTTVNGNEYRIVIANNRIYLNEAEINTCVPTQVNWPTDGNGIILDDFMSSQVGDAPDAWNHQWKNVLYPHRTLIMNNIVYGNGGRGILVSGSSHADVIHNTVYNNLQSQPLRDHCGMLGEIAGEGTDMRVFNNIAVAQHKYGLSLKLLSVNIPDRQNIVYGNNLTYGGLGFDNDPTYQSIVSDAGSNITTQDPLLAAPSLLGDADFHLKKGSPAINKGSAANSVPTDFEGKARPIGGLPDIGAYETNYLGSGMCGLPAIKFLLDGK